MKKIDQRGAAAFEFCIVAMAVFALLFASFDLGRYAIAMQSLRALANAGARATMVKCYNDAAIGKTISPSTCTGDYLTDGEKWAIAPFFHATGLAAPTVTTTVVGSSLVVTAYPPPGFQMMIFSSLWGISFNSASTSTKIPF
jgi:Flp pilus assembly protein TadG